MSTENQVAEEVIYQALSAGLNIPIYKYVAPPKVKLPVIVYNPMSDGKDLTEVASYRLLTDFLYKVVVYDDISKLDELDLIADKIDDLLHRITAEPRSKTGYVYAIVRQTSHSLASTVDGKTYIARGGIYRVLAQALNT